MKTPFQFFRQAAVALICAGALPPVAGRGATAFVYDTGTEILTTGDFNGDGAADVLVLDKLTGNVRAGFLDLGGNLAWSAPLVSGVENVSSAAAGRFLTATSDVLAVTGPDLNRINLISLANTNSAGTPTVIIPSGIGPHTLVTLDTPVGLATSSPTNLLVASSQNAGGVELMERLQVSGGAATTPAAGGLFNETGPFDRGNALALSPANSPSFAAGLVRGAVSDQLDVLQFTNGAGGTLFSYTNLSPGGDYVFGNFNGENLPRFAFYRPGDSNLTLAPVVPGDGLQFGASNSLALAEGIERVFYLPPAASGTFLVEFADGVQAVRFYGNTPIAGNVYGTGMGSTNNVFTGVVPLANGQFVLLDAAAGAAASTHAQVAKFDGTNFSQISTSALPVISIRTTRANVWLFQSEPFVNRYPGFIASYASPDWSDVINGLPGVFSVYKESDGGSASGLGSFATNTIGAPPSGANYGLANQVADGISIFSYAPPRAAEPVTITISPPPGLYSGPVQIAFSTLSGGDSVYYHVGAADGWHLYAASFLLTNDAAVTYFGTNSSGARSHLLTANYSFANNVTPVATLNLTNGAPATNNTVVGTGGGGVIITISPNGTVFYGRKDNSSGTVWAINLDGSDDTYITTGARPRVSRDGRYLAFMRGTNFFHGSGGNIWVRDLSNGNERAIFTNLSQVIGYDWDSASPPNLIFDYGCSFWKVSVSNTAAVFPLTNDCYGYAPAVNPVDGRIAIFDLGFNYGAGIDVAPATGGQGQHLGSTVPPSQWPAWSPDGTRLSFAYLNNPYATHGLADLYTINADGTAMAQISAFSSGNDGFLYGAIWTPGGNALLGAGGIYGTNGLWLIPLTDDAQHCDCPARLLPTTPGDPVDFAGSVIVPPPATIAKPDLLIRADDTSVIVYWSTNHQGFYLASTRNLATGTTWTNVSGPYYLNGGYYEYHEAKTMLTDTEFFRLQYPGTIIIQPPQP